jgi:hypothetical protein
MLKLSFLYSFGINTLISIGENTISGTSSSVVIVWFSQVFGLNLHSSITKNAAEIIIKIEVNVKITIFGFRFILMPTIKLKALYADYFEKLSVYNIAL